MPIIKVQFLKKIHKFELKDEDFYKRFKLVDLKKIITKKYNSSFDSVVFVLWKCKKKWKEINSHVFYLYI